jgi:hypothetical protein
LIAVLAIVALKLFKFSYNLASPVVASLNFWKEQIFPYSHEKYKLPNSISA